MKDNIPTKRNPFLQGETTLFDLDEEYVVVEDELDPAQKADVFLSKYMEKIDPIVRYEKFFDGSVKSVDIIFREIKNLYKRTVVEKGWKEEKYIVVLDEIFKNNANLNIFTIDRLGRKYDSNDLSSQKKTRRVRRSR